MINFTEAFLKGKVKDYNEFKTTEGYFKEKAKKLVSESEDASPSCGIVSVSNHIRMIEKDNV